MSTRPDYKAKLARIRENQRRSRARKREYVQELQQRLRIYERRGIELSTEVLVLARQVAEENHKLRNLLKEHSYADEDAVKYIHASTTPNRMGSVLPQIATAPTYAVKETSTPRQPDIAKPCSSFDIASQINKITQSSPLLLTSPSWEAIAAKSTPRFNDHDTDASMIGASHSQFYCNTLMGNLIHGNGIYYHPQHASASGVDASYIVASTQAQFSYSTAA